jgi:hypothetical protein
MPVHKIRVRVPIVDEYVFHVEAETAEEALQTVIDGGKEMLAEEYDSREDWEEAEYTVEGSVE